MGPKVRFARLVRSLPLKLSLVVPALLVCTVVRPALASTEVPMDANALVELEQRAAAAEPKDRCFLYSELLHGWTELASRNMASGNDTDAQQAIAHADADVQHLKSALAADSKRLKNAELILEHTAHRLSDMVRVASMEQHDAMQDVLKRLNNVHDALLAQLFAH